MAGAEPLLDQIERDALDEGASLAGALRKCIALGGRTGSEELRDWATVELQGYKDLKTTPLPDYRVVPAPLMIDGFSPNAQITGETISPWDLPDVVKDDIKSEVTLRQGVGEIEALIAQGDAEGIIRLGLPMGSEIAKLMNAENRHGRVTRIYWGVVPAAVRGVTDQIRTALTALVAEVRATTPRGDTVPTSDAIDQAVQVVVHGKKARVNVSSSQATGGSTATVQSAPPPEESESEFWTRGKKIGAFIVGLSGVAGAVFAAIRTF